jgi:hypothetical protein
MPGMVDRQGKTRRDDKESAEPGTPPYHSGIPIRALELEACIPSVEHTLDLIRDQYATRLHRLGHRNPAIQKLPCEWREGEPAAAPPPLPLHKRVNRNRESPPKTTRLQTLARSTYPPELGEKVNPFQSAPLRKTARDLGGRVSIDANEARVKKSEAVKEHEKRASKYEAPPEHLLCTRTARSWRTRSVRSAAWATEGRIPPGQRVHHTNWTNGIQVELVKMTRGGAHRRGSARH